MRVSPVVEQNSLTYQNTDNHKFHNQTSSERVKVSARHDKVSYTISATKRRHQACSVDEENSVTSRIIFSKNLNFPSVAPKLSAASTLILSTECSMRELLDSNCVNRPLMPSKTRNRLSAYFFIVLSTAATVAVSTASLSERTFRSYEGA